MTLCYVTALKYSGICYSIKKKLTTILASSVQVSIRLVTVTRIQRQTLNMRQIMPSLNNTKQTASIDHAHWKELEQAQSVYMFVYFRFVSRNFELRLDINF